MSNKTIDDVVENTHTLLGIYLSKEHKIILKQSILQYHKQELLAYKESYKKELLDELIIKLNNFIIINSKEINAKDSNGAIQIELFIKQKVQELREKK